MPLAPEINILAEARRVFAVEMAALEAVKDGLGPEFERAVRMIQACRGKVVVVGMGKSGHIGCKMAATLASLGTPSFYLHPAEALHGDLGMVGPADIVLAISNSGESEEVTRLLPNLKVIGVPIVGITSKAKSTLAKGSDCVLVFPPFDEACAMNMAPTSSTTATLVLGDALAIVLSRLAGFGKDNYALFHPAGALGKKLLLRVEDLMVAGDKNACVPVGDALKHAIVVMGEKGLSIVNVLDGNGRLCGILTDGDIRRLFEKEVDVYRCSVDEVMVRHPMTIRVGTLAVVALKVMTERAKQITALPVLDEQERVVGSIRLSDIVKAGIL